ncbi:hypothetical protein BDQ17DRAFT_1425872 [Cyathus striatus]|nr:hypothetical protein BDQ17DRAFT_1425872 [Cyathus striatus]
MPERVLTLTVTIGYTGLKATQYFSKLTSDAVDILFEDLDKLKLPHPQKKNVAQVRHGCVKFWWPQVFENGVLHRHLRDRIKGPKRAQDLFDTLQISTLNLQERIAIPTSGDKRPHPESSLASQQAASTKPHGVPSTGQQHIPSTSKRPLPAKPPPYMPPVVKMPRPPPPTSAPTTVRRPPAEPRREAQKFIGDTSGVSPTRVRKRRKIDTGSGVMVGVHATSYPSCILTTGTERGISAHAVPTILFFDFLLFYSCKLSSSLAVIFTYLPSNLQTYPLAPDPAPAPTFAPASTPTASVYNPDQPYIPPYNPSRPNLAPPPPTRQDSGEYTPFDRWVAPPAPQWPTWPPSPLPQPPASVSQGVFPPGVTTATAPAPTPAQVSQQTSVQISTQAPVPITLDHIPSQNLSFEEVEKVIRQNYGEAGNGMSVTEILSSMAQPMSASTAISFSNSFVSDVDVKRNVLQSAVAAPMVGPGGSGSQSQNVLSQRGGAPTRFGPSKSAPVAPTVPTPPPVTTQASRQTSARGSAQASSTFPSRSPQNMPYNPPSASASSARQENVAKSMTVSRHANLPRLSTGSIPPTAAGARRKATVKLEPQEDVIDLTSPVEPPRTTSYSDLLKSITAANTDSSASGSNSRASVPKLEPQEDVIAQEQTSAMSKSYSDLLKSITAYTNREAATPKSASASTPSSAIGTPAPERHTRASASYASTRSVSSDVRWLEAEMQKETPVQESPPMKYSDLLRHLNKPMSDSGARASVPQSSGRSVGSVTTQQESMLQRHTPALLAPSTPTSYSDLLKSITASKEMTTTSKKSARVGIFVLNNGGNVTGVEPSPAPQVNSSMGIPESRSGDIPQNERVAQGPIAHNSSVTESREAGTSAVTSCLDDLGIPVSKAIDDMPTDMDIGTPLSFSIPLSTSTSMTSVDQLKPTSVEFPQSALGGGGCRTAPYGASGQFL